MEATGAAMLKTSLKTAAVIAWCMAAPTAWAQTERAPFAVRLSEARTTLQVDENGLHGQGAAVIAEAVGPARYVLLGEDHFSREIPRFTTGICRIMAPGGLRALAVETGPEAVAVVNETLRRPDRVEAIAAFSRTHPDAMAFQNGRDESDMSADCAKLAGDDFQIWGLDQEFFGSAGYLFERMLAAHPGRHARAAIERLAALERTMSAAAVASGSPADLFINAVTDPQLEEAGSPIRQDGGARVQELFAALVETRSLFMGQNNDGDESNRQRGLLMRRNLVRRLAASPASSRVLFKFGDVHMPKGFNSLGQRDLGNFVAERAEGDGATSLHIAVYGARGVHATYGGVGRQVGHEPFVLTDDEDYAWIKDALGATADGETRDWMLVDLRALRANPPRDMPARWRRAVREYDLLVVAPELTPSELLGASQ